MQLSELNNLQPTVRHRQRKCSVEGKRTLDRFVGKSVGIRSIL